jgi:hypothetical protein
MGSSNHVVVLNTKYSDCNNSSLSDFIKKGFSNFAFLHVEFLRSKAPRFDNHRLDSSLNSEFGLEIKAVVD